MSKEDKTVAVVCTTGIGSSHLRDGTAVDSCAVISDATQSNEILADQMLNNESLEHVFNRLLHTDSLIIEEVSMCSSYMFQTLDHISQTGRKSDLLFGGMQIIASRDCYQLPPVLNWKGLERYAFQYKA